MTEVPPCQSRDGPRPGPVLPPFALILLKDPSSETSMRKAQAHRGKPLQFQMSYLLPWWTAVSASAPAWSAAAALPAPLECDLEDAKGRLVSRATSVCAIRQQG
jgi:hypothetical protein